MHHMEWYACVLYHFTPSTIIINYLKLINHKLIILLILSQLIILKLANSQFSIVNAFLVLG